ncbi:MAG: hypothetical protein C4290_11820 [Chloroflexota bacterium]
MALNKPWIEATEEHLRRLPGALGVYEIGDAAGTVLYIGFAGGRSRFLRGEIAAKLAPESPNPVTAGGRFLRYEVNQMYLTRYVELLEQHLGATGDLPPGNKQPGEYIPTLGRAGITAASSMPSTHGG